MLELLVTVALVGILSAVAVPSFNSALKRNARESFMLDLNSALGLSRSESITGNSNVSICRSTNSTNCVGSTAGDWNDGWIIFTDSGTSGIVDGTDTIIQVQQAMNGQMTIVLKDSGNGNVTGDYLEFNADGFIESISTGAYFKFCSADNNSEYSRAIWIAITGRASNSLDDADCVHNDMVGNNLSCP